MIEKLKSVAQLIEELRDGEKQFVMDYIKSVGGDGLVCPGECGCGIDDLFNCDMFFPEDHDKCYPAKGKMGKWEGENSMLYYKIELPEEIPRGVEDMIWRCTDCGHIFEDDGYQSPDSSDKECACPVCRHESIEVPA